MTDVSYYCSTKLVQLQNPLAWVDETPTDGIAQVSYLSP